MAECSFSRCVQERRVIKKELQRWTKNMVVVVGLERVAEELMGRRKWKQCQNALSACDAAAAAAFASSDPLLESPIAAASEETKDWTPPETCTLCNEKSLLIDRAPSPGSELDSSSNDSAYRESPPPAYHPRTPPAMTAYESVKLAAIAALSHSPDGPAVMSPNMFYPPGHHGGLFTPWYLPPHLSARASTPHAMEVPVQQAMPVKEEVAVGGAEMPLDLSAKATDAHTMGVPQSLRVPSMDSKQIYKAKPRMSAVAGRRTYTEDELQAALRDIQSGKLGTRRAAVIYGIPRSTLRNKVYKLAMERERDAQLLLSAPTPPPASLLLKRGGGDDDDKELSGAEEEREVEKALRKPLLSMEDLVRFSMLESNGLANPEAIRSLLTQSKMEGRFPFPPGDAWGGLEHSALGPYISQLLAAGKAQEAEGSDFVPKFSPPLLPELVRRMMAEEKMLMESHAKRNGSVERESRPSSSANRAGAGGDDDNSDAEATPSNVILKIPSFKPTSSSSSSKNGTAAGEPFPSPSQESSSQPGYNGAESRSPPSMIGKGIGVSLRDVIAKSISQKFQQGGEMALPMPLSQKLLLSPDAESPYKRGRYSPPMGHMHHHAAAIKHNNNNHHMDDRNAQKMSPTGKSSMLSQSHSAGGGGGGGGGGGKGTRPKRGKYRNYDRDSLVEAVRAVQRGEMSVHRAGSYYGVPHSTLEYKVKERHLMRPRKRDPKPPLDEQPKRKDEHRVGGSPQDKPGAGGPKLQQLGKPPFPTSPLQNPANGLKIPPMFDPAMSPLAYSTPPPFPFWPPNPFHGLPMPDFPRGPHAHEQLIASHMMQRLQEGSRLPPGHPGHALLNPPPPPAEPQLGTNVRKIAESLYDGTGTNGNFLDGIIRSSLEMGLPTPGKEGGVSERERAPENLSNKALLDQLCRNSRITPLPVHDGSTSEDDSGKRSSVDGKDDTDRRMDFSPSSDDSGRKERDRRDMDDDDFDTKSAKDRYSELGSPVSKDSRDNDDSDNDVRMDEGDSACDSKDNVQRSAGAATPAREDVATAASTVDEDHGVDGDEASSQSTETKTNIDLKSD